MITFNWGTMHGLMSYVAREHADEVCAAALKPGITLAGRGFEEFAWLLLVGKPMERES